MPFHPDLLIPQTSHDYIVYEHTETRSRARKPHNTALGDQDLNPYQQGTHTHQVHAAEFVQPEAVDSRDDAMELVLAKPLVTVCNRVVEMAQYPLLHQGAGEDLGGRGTRQGIGPLPG